MAQAQRSAATMHGERHERAAEGGAPQALDASPRVAAHRVMLAAVHDSPRVAAQRVQLNGAFSEADSAGADSPIQRVIRVGKKKLKSRRDLSQVWRAHKVDELLGLGDVQSDMLRAQLLRLAEGENFTEFDDWDDAHDRLQDPMLLITAGDGVVSIIKTTTDLSIWLESYPSRDEDAPKNFADTTVLQGALGLLAQL